MSSQTAEHWKRREFLGGLTLTGIAGLLGLGPERAGAEPPPETTTLRLLHTPSICMAPQHVAEEFLRGEGFTDVQYLKREATIELFKALGSGEAQISMAFAGPFIIEVDAGAPIVMLSGVHPGCFELFGNDRVRSIRDLKGKTVAVPGLGSSPHVFLSIMAAHVGVDPRKEINWVIHPRPEAIGSSPGGRWMPSWAFLLTRKSSGKRKSGTWWSTARWTGPGPSISAASQPGTRSSSGSTRWLPSGRCARS